MELGSHVYIEKREFLCIYKDSYTLKCLFLWRLSQYLTVKGMLKIAFQWRSSSCVASGPENRFNLPSHLDVLSQIFRILA